MFIERKTGDHYDEYFKYGIKYVSYSKTKKDDGKLRYANSMKIITSPTSNCQLTTIAPMSEMLAASSYTKEDVVTFLSYLRDNGHIATTSVLFDIYDKFSDKLREALGIMEAEILLDSPYTNPTGSKMRFIYANITPDYEDEDEYEDDEYYDDDDDY